MHPDAPPASVTPAAAVVKRGRGTFSHRLRTEEQESQHAQDINGACSTVASMAFPVPTVVIPTAPVVPPAPTGDGNGEEDSFAAAKKDIPVDSAPFYPREHFGVYEGEGEADTVRQLLFRADKRRRYCVIVGELQNTDRHVVLKLFGHSGLKPFKLQNKPIRLINLSIGRLRLPPKEHGDGGEVREENNVDAEEATTVPEIPFEEPVEPSALREDDMMAPSDDPGEAGMVFKDDEDYDGNVDQHTVSPEDEVVPLLVKRTDVTIGLLNEMSLATSPVLTSKRFDALTAYFLKEFHFLLNLEDVRLQHVSVRVNLGAAYCCLARHGAYSTPLKHATFTEFIERLNDESMQLYFLKDCPTCVSRAVDMECAALNHEATLTIVKIVFFSNERHSRSVARAVWDGEFNAFRLLDMENIGVSFNWTIFSLDETYVSEEDLKGNAQKTTDKVDAAASPEVSGSSIDPQSRRRGPVRNKTVAYPFEVEFRAFRRWKQHAEHPAASLAEEILEKLSVAEYNMINHGSSIGYERMDLSHVCEVDFASDDFNVESIIVEHTARVKPLGTDLLVDNTTSFFIENFAAARQLHEKLAKGKPVVQGGPRKHARGRGSRGGASLGRGGIETREGPLQPSSKLSFFRSRGSSIHWKLRPTRSVEENIAPVTEALRFVQQVLHTSNDIERTSARGGDAPDAL